MSKDEIFEYLKDRTYKKKKDGEQVKVTVEELIKNLDLNEQTIYRNLSGLKKWKDIKFEQQKIKRMKNGRIYVFKMKKWWVE